MDLAPLIDTSGPDLIRSRLLAPAPRQCTRYLSSYTNNPQNRVLSTPHTNPVKLKSATPLGTSTVSIFDPLPRHPFLDPLLSSPPQRHEKRLNDSPYSLFPIVSPLS